MTATGILAPINPYASREAKNLYAFLASLTDSQTFLTGQFDIQNTDDIWRRTVEQLGVEPALYSCRYTVDTPVEAELQVAGEHRRVAPGQYIFYGKE